MVITRNADFSAPGVETYPSLEAALAAAASSSEKIYIIGGGEVYSQALPLAHTLEITHIDLPAPDDADTFFPDIDPNEWQLTTISDPVADLKDGQPTAPPTASPPIAGNHDNHDKPRFEGQILAIEPKNESFEGRVLSTNAYNL